MYKVLFVCTANVCRSPLGEAILNRKIAGEKLEKKMNAESCGVWANEGQAPSSLSQTVARQNGLDVSRHRSQPVSLYLVKQSHLILCMAPHHKRDLLNIFPHYDSKIFTLKEFGRKTPPAKQAVDDPIGMNLNFYRRIFNEIRDEIDRIWPVIRQDAEKLRSISGVSD